MTTTSSASSHGNSASGYTAAQLAAMIGQPIGTVAKGHAGQGANNSNKPTAGDPIETVAGATVANQLENYGSTLAPHTTAFDSAMSTIIPIGTAAGLGAVAAPALVGSLGSVGGAAAGGAISGADRAALTGQNVVKGALVGAAGGAAASAAAPLTNSLSSATGLSPGISSALVKGATGAASGALTSGLTGGSVGTGALMGGLSGAASPIASSTGLPSGLVNAGIGAAVGGLIGSGSSNNVASGVAAGMSNLGTVGNMAGVTNNLSSGLGIGQTLLGSVGGIVGAVGGIQQGNANGNVLSEASAGTGVGTTTGYSGPNSTATTNNGQVNTALSAPLSQLNNNLGAYGNQQSQIAQSFNGAAPANVQNAINTQAGNVNNLPQGTQGQLNNQSALQGSVQQSQMGLINSGTSALNNPLTTNLQQAAQTQLGTAGSDFTNTYNTQLSALNQQLALPTQQAEAELANSQFGRGQMGTSGGALQTQAFATGLGQAYLGNQQTAYNEAMNAQNSATSNAATLNAGANSNLNTANSLLANAYGQFNNTSALNTNTANSVFNQNSVINQLGNQYGQQNVQNQTTAATLPATLAGQYGTNANLGVTGAGNLNNIDMSGFNAALSTGTQQGNQYNNAISNAARVTASGQPTNGLTSIGSALSSPGLGNLVSGIGSAFNGIGGTAAGTGALNSGVTSANIGSLMSNVQPIGTDIYNPDPSTDMNFDTTATY